MKWSEMREGESHRTVLETARVKDGLDACLG